MNERIIYKRDDGGVSIITPTGELSVEETAKKDVPTGKPYKIVDVSEIPTDRSMRDAWDMDESMASGKAVAVNMSRALPIAQERIRSVRGSKLERLDVSFMRAQERGEPTQRIVDLKQTLRDATEDSRITGATTPESLKTAMEAVESEIEALEQ